MKNDEINIVVAAWIVLGVVLLFFLLLGLMAAYPPHDICSQPSGLAPAEAK